MKKYTPYLITFAIGLAAAALYPVLRPFARKIPVVGKWL